MRRINVGAEIRHWRQSVSTYIRGQRNKQGGYLHDVQVGKLIDVMHERKQCDDIETEDNEFSR